jgi:membrane protease YdiL (CAAX protease family)
MPAGKQPEETHATFPNKFEAFYIVAVLIAVEFLLAVALSDSALLNDVDWQGASGFVTVVGNGLVFIFLLTYKRMSYRSLFHPATHTVVGTLSKLWLPIALIVPGMVLLTSVLNGVVMWLVPMSNNDLEAFSDMVSIGAIPIFFSCIAAPLLEEMLFRGIILRSFLQQYSRLHAILWSSAIFGLAHLNPYQFFTALVLGIVLGWLYERTSSLWPSIYLHGAFNGFVTFSANAEGSGLDDAWTWFLAAAFACAIAGGAMLLRTLEPAVQQRKSGRDSEG